MTARRGLFRHISGEESQTDVFAALLAWSLDTGPTVLNAIHDDIEFGAETRVAATQRNGLPRHASENGRRRTLDWVVADDERLVGYESKTGGGVPSTSQLREEQRKLDANSRGRETTLFVVSDHTDEPDIVAESAARWMSWYDVAGRVLALDDDDTAIRMLQQMFTERDYDGFDGFTPFTQENNWLTQHDAEFVDLVYDVDRHLDDITLDTEGRLHIGEYTYTSLPNLRSAGWKTINHAHLLAHYHPEEATQYVSNGFATALVVPALENAVYVGMDLKPNLNAPVADLLRENADGLAAMVADEEMEVRTSYNSLNNPNRELLIYDGSDAIADLLRTRAGDDDWKRLLFGWPVDTDQPPNAVVRECAERVEQLERLFHDGSEYLSRENLPDWAR